MVGQSLKETISAVYVPMSDKTVVGNLPEMLRDEAAGWFRSDHHYSYYFAIGRAVHPKRVLEIGLRLGYSLVAIMRGSTVSESVVGVDTEIYVPGSNSLAEKNLRAIPYCGRLALFNEPSFVFLNQCRDTFDLVHIDGDHAEDAAFLDVVGSWARLSWGGVLLVDDAIRINEVEKAIQRAMPFLERTGLCEHFILPTENGCFVAKKGDEASPASAISVL